MIKIFVILVLCFSLKSAETEHSNLIKQVILRLHKTLEFFEQDYESVNLDGLYGIRISQGVFINLSHKAKSNWFYQSIKKPILNLSHRISFLANKVYFNLFSLSIDYVENFKRLVDRPYMSKTKIRTGLLQDKFLQVNFNKNDSFNEKLSDECYLELLNGRHGDPIEPQCFEFYTTDGTSGYSLTHQLLFFMIADNIDRFGDVSVQLLDFLLQENTINKNMASYLAKQKDNDLKSQIFRYFCTRVYYDADNMFKKFTNANDFKQDLFIEQIVLCGSLGFEEFFKIEWLEIIFSFQNQNGCFNQRENNFDLDLKNVAFDRVLNAINSKRMKRYDSIMKDGCSSHQTGLALAYFSLMFEYLL